MMVQGVLGKVLKSENLLNVNRSRCLRMRYDLSGCTECIQRCHSGAISIDEDVRIDEKACTGCMLCSSVCPSESFEVNGLDFFSLVGRLRKIPSSVLSPVLGCTQTNAASHIKTSCLGFLSEEHLIALSFLMQKPLQLNLTGCPDCDNGFIMESLEKRISDIEANSIKIKEKIRMIKNTSGLDFREISYDRRGFFSALKNMSFAQAAVLFESDSQEDGIQSYTSKKLPFRRQLMNRIMKIPGNEQAGFLENYYYTITTSEACNNCFACVGMCPTGALKIDSGEHTRALVFSSSLCTGCGLCKKFCSQQAVQLNRGFSGDSPFDFQPTMGHSVGLFQRRR